MKKINNIFILIIFILLFFISYSFDEKVSILFKNKRFVLLDLIFGIITDFRVLIVVMLVIPSMLFYKKNKRLVYLLLTSFITSITIAFVIKLIFLRQRPIDAFTYPLTNIINYSFPSMHSMVVFSLLPILINYLPKQKYFWISFAFFVSFSRIYLGFHFLSDVVFGTLTGYIIGDFLIQLYDNGKLWKK